MKSFVSFTSAILRDNASANAQKKPINPLSFLSRIQVAVLTVAALASAKPEAQFLNPWTGYNGFNAYSGYTGLNGVNAFSAGYNGLYPYGLNAAYGYSPLSYGVPAQTAAATAPTSKGQRKGRTCRSRRVRVTSGSRNRLCRISPWAKTCGGSMFRAFNCAGSVTKGTPAVCVAVATSSGRGPQARMARGGAVPKCKDSCVKASGTGALNPSSGPRRTTNVSAWAATDHRCSAVGKAK